jgi:hypothetical protein
MPPHKRFAQQNLEIDGIHFRRFESNYGAPGSASVVSKKAGSRPEGRLPVKQQSIGLALG